MAIPTATVGSDLIDHEEMFDYLTLPTRESFCCSESHSASG